MTPLTAARLMRTRRDLSAVWIATAVAANCDPLEVDVRAFRRREAAYSRLLLVAAIGEAAA